MFSSLIEFSLLFYHIIGDFALALLGEWWLYCLKNTQKPSLSIKPLVSVLIFLEE